MSTLNPLFLDSTKPIGDKVVTNVELLGVLLHDGDFLYFEVIDQFGFSQRFAMKTIATKKTIKYTAEVWLKYQHEIQYRFVIEADGQTLHASAIRKTRACHIISEPWEPVRSPDSSCDFVSAKKDQRGIKPSRETMSTSSKSLPGKPPKQAVKPASKPIGKPLCKPQFFDQIKSLLDDLL